MATHPYHNLDASVRRGPGLAFKGVHIAGKPENSRWDLRCEGGVITSIDESGDQSELGLPVRMVCPSLCHPHIHLDKCFLLQHPKYADLEIMSGDFKEALTLTSEAKSRFRHEDLLERGRALILESIGFGVTAMRAFVEVDLGVRETCLKAGLALKEEFRDRCYIQLCVFAQDPIVSYEDGGEEMMELLEKAVDMPGVEVFGSTPYVEGNGDRELQIKNIEFAIRTAKKYRKHLDFHIDYNLDPTKQSMVVKTLELVRSMEWPCNKDNLDTFRSITFGHCTRLTLFNSDEWSHLSGMARGLPVSFVGLPTSDMLMMGRPSEGDEGSQRVRGTLQVLQMHRLYGINTAIGINNVGNAFTPHGSCDPLSLASLGVGLYQAGTKEEADLLFQCVSSRAKLAMGLEHGNSDKVHLDIGDAADFIIFANRSSTGSCWFRSRRTVQDLVYDAGPDRTTIYAGHIVS